MSDLFQNILRVVGIIELSIKIEENDY